MSVNPSKGGGEPAESHMHMTKLHTRTHTRTHTHSGVCIQHAKRHLVHTVWSLCVHPVSVSFVSLMTFVLTLRILCVRGGTIRGIYRKTNIHYSFISSVRRDKLWIIHKTKLCTSPAPPRHAAVVTSLLFLFYNLEKPSSRVFLLQRNTSNGPLLLFCTTVAIFSILSSIKSFTYFLFFLLTFH